MNRRQWKIFQIILLVEAEFNTLSLSLSPSPNESTHNLKEQKLNEKKGSCYYFNFKDSLLLKTREMNKDYKVIPY